MTASVPSDLPASLSYCASYCAHTLRKESDVMNSDAEGLLESSKVDTVVFDKTGTLTTDTQAMTSIVYPPHRQATETGFPRFLANIVLAGGHSIVGVGEDDANLVGDPVDLAALRYTGWKYDAREKSATFIAKNEIGKNATKLYILCSFPFDPLKKMSSALVLVRNKAAVQIWAVVKGSPNKVRDLLVFASKGLPDDDWYNKKVKSLGKAGYRSIGLGALNATDMKVAKLLFPGGLPAPSNLTVQLQGARRRAHQLLRRGDIETTSSDLVDMTEMRSAGFACFDAPLRSSSSRVIKELKASVDVIMLTGDEPYASYSIARKAGVTGGGKKTLLLTLNSNGVLAWEINKKAKRFTLERAKKMTRDVESERAELIVTGDAMAALISGTMGRAADYVERVLLPRTSLVASASPCDKSIFIRWLKGSQKKRVLMCGDGVNDIAALREATVSVAMLSGFGHKSDDAMVEDTEDARRKERLKRRCIGSNRSKLLKSTPTKNISNSTSNPFIVLAREFTSGLFGEELCARLEHGVSENMHQLRCRKEELPPLARVYYACLASVTNEMTRQKNLKKGGSKAAKILAEDRLRKSLESKATLEGHSIPEMGDIRTGESCLASSFTLLRPSISGVESILRTGWPFLRLFSFCASIKRISPIVCLCVFAQESVLLHVS